MAKLPTHVFVGYLEQSGLVPEDVLKRSLDVLRRDHRGMLPDDANIVADHLIDSRLITRWHADKLFDRKYKGFFLGKYKLLSHVGTGAVGSVYIAEHLLMKQKRAIKAFSGLRVNGVSHLARFHLEARAIATLDHPNIVGLYDFDDHDGLYYIVMEFVDGKDLQQIVKQEGPLPLEFACKYIAQAAQGLGYAHDHNLIHRAIKPTNLLIDDQGIVRILDLGLASFLESAMAQANIAASRNSLAYADYLSPEQMLNSLDLDVRTDIYSLGCTLYFLLTGHPPFTDGSLAQRIARHHTSMPEDVRKDRPDCPRDLVDICVKMLRKKPEHRYQNMEDVSNALQRWLGHHGYGYDSRPSFVTEKAVPRKGSKARLGAQGRPYKRQPSSSQRFPVFPLPGTGELTIRALAAFLMTTLLIVSASAFVVWCIRR